MSIEDIDKGHRQTLRQNKEDQCIKNLKGKRRIHMVRENKNKHVCFKDIDKGRRLTLRQNKEDQSDDNNMNISQRNHKKSDYTNNANERTKENKSITLQDGRVRLKGGSSKIKRLDEVDRYTKINNYFWMKHRQKDKKWIPCDTNTIWGSSQPL